MRQEAAQMILTVIFQSMCIALQSIKIMPPAFYKQFYNRKIQATSKLICFAFPPLRLPLSFKVYSSIFF